MLRRRSRQSKIALACVFGLATGFVASDVRAQDGRLPSPQMPAGAAYGGPASGQGMGGAGGAGMGDAGQSVPGEAGGAAGANTSAGAADGGAGAGSPAAGAGADALNAALAARGDAAVGSGGSLGFPVIGDQGPLSARQRIPVPPPIPDPFPPNRPPGTPGGRRSSILAPSVRALKMSENQSPRPQDRVTYGFNYFSEVNKAVNERFQSPVENMKVYRHLFGFEKTFNEGRGSFGMRIPLNTLTADSRPGSGFPTPTTTALGDLNLYGKYILAEDQETGSLISGGIQLTPPTGPSQFAGSKYVNSLHSMQFQPFLGFLLNYDRFFLQGFSAIDVPTDQRDVTMLYNDFALGYVLYRDLDANSDAFVTGIAPVFEVHVNTPLNHRGAYDLSQIAATADAVNLTYGLNFELMRSSVATFGIVTPVASPKAFEVEYVFLLNIRFGASRNRSLFPVVGG